MSETNYKARAHFCREGLYFARLLDKQNLTRVVGFAAISPLFGGRWGPTTFKALAGVCHLLGAPCADVVFDY